MIKISDDRDLLLLKRTNSYDAAIRFMMKYPQKYFWVEVYKYRVLIDCGRYYFVGFIDRVCDLKYKFGGRL